MINWLKDKLPRPLQAFIGAFAGLNALVWSFAPAAHFMSPPLFLFTFIFWVAVGIAITVWVEDKK